jgi:mannan endo-1,4-beta-mannosidase
VRKFAVAAAAAAALAMVLAGCTSPVAWQTGTRASPAAGAVIPSGPMLGVYEQGVPGSWARLSEFTTETGVRPQIVLYYSAWYEKFRTAFAEQARSHGAYVLVQLQPNGVTLASIAAGRSDGYLRSYADAVRSFGYPVILSFGHEMNGGWYSWGDGHQPPSAFVAAWRHVVTVFRSAGATNVTWLWTVNSTNAASSLLRQWWPGADWVNWIGLDGYYYQSTDTFQSVFGETLTDIRKFSAAPVLISETAVGVTPDRGSQIIGLFAGAAADHVLGLVWFDQAQHDGLLHQDWRLEDDAAALARYRAAAREYTDLRALVGSEPLR